VLITALATQQPDRSINLDGPPRQAAFDAEGNPTQAALGFAKKCGVELSEIDQSGPKLRFSQHIAGKPTASLLPTIVEDSLNDLPIPKRMRWGASKEEFVRPTQWLVMLLGDQVIDCTILPEGRPRFPWSPLPPSGKRGHHCAGQLLEDLRAAMCWPTPTSVAS
jgi:glycyl-tRNA synthetase beta chain